MPCVKSNDNLTINLKLNGNYYDKPDEVAKHFNDFFVNIGQKLANEILSSETSQCNSFLNDKVKNTIFLEPPRVNEILNIINSLKSKKCCDDNVIPSHFIKVAGDILAPYLSYFFYLSFDFGIFPDFLKIASLIPIHKIDSKCDMTNYRPISILLCLFQILEKLIKDRIMSFLNKHNILYPYQYGFRKDYSSSHAVLDLTTTVYDATNDKKLACLVMIDLKKAFDTVCHERLLLKLNNYGIKGNAYDLLKSYLTNRYQYVRTNNNSSTLKQIKYGVPQGSILGPLLYILYVNDFSNAINCNSKLYADDICLIIKEKSIDFIRLSINEELVKVNRWMNANQLTINLKKLTILLIQPTLKNIPLNFEIRFKNQNISLCEYVNYLGINLDQYLNFKPHISILAKKMAKSVGMLWK